MSEGATIAPQGGADESGRLTVIAAAIARARLSARHRRFRELLLAALIIAALAMVPIVSGSSFNLGRYSVALAILMAAIGMNLAYGYAGELVLAHPAIMAMGAYGAGIANATFGLGSGASSLIGLVCGVIGGVMIMAAGLRVSGWYLAFITLFAGLILPHIVELASSITGGADGLTGIQPLELGGFRFPGWLVYELVLACFLLVWAGAAYAGRSRFGLELRALRDAPRAAQSVGINLTQVRFGAYVASAVPAALAGVLLAFVDRFVHAETFGLNLALLLLTGVVLGGAGTVWGPVLGMTPLIAMSFWVGPFSPYNAIALGLALLLGVIVFPEGIAPALQRRFAKRDVPPSGEPNQAVRAENREPVPPRGPRRSADPRQGSPNAIEVEGVVKRFGSVSALAGVSFSVAPGMLCGLVGPNGSGKSTLLNILSGFITPDAGRIRMLGSDVGGWPAPRIARAGVGRTFQVPQLIADLSVLENIGLGLHGGTERRSAVAVSSSDERIIRTYAQIGLPADLADQPLSSVPLGLKRLVEVGRAIVSSPELLLLDEPAAGLNDRERAALGRLLIALKDGGMTILLVEHDVRFVMTYCDELLLLENGEVACRADMNGALPDRLTEYLSYGLDLAEGEPA